MKRQINTWFSLFLNSIRMGKYQHSFSFVFRGFVPYMRESLLLNSYHFCFVWLTSKFFITVTKVTPKIRNCRGNIGQPNLFIE
jgi:hypothetical protein